MRPWVIKRAEDDLLDQRFMGDIFWSQGRLCGLNSPWYIDDRVCEILDIIVILLDNKSWSSPMLIPCLYINTMYLVL